MFIKLQFLQPNKLNKVKNVNKSFFFYKITKSFPSSILMKFVWLLNTRLRKYIYSIDEALLKLWL